MYPSISICKQYAFDDTKLDFFDHDFKDISTPLHWITKYSYDLEWTLHFFTHPGVFNKTFPCTTILGGKTPGRPCVFPIQYYDGVSHDQCFLMDTPNPACLTKLKENGTNYDMFGYCHPNCSGEMPDPYSPYNLALKNNTYLWQSYFYDLSSYDNGHCHTYSPPARTPPGFTSRLYFMLARLDSGYQDYDIFLHERDQFWPRSDMFSFGQSEPVSLPAGTELEAVFTMKDRAVNEIFTIFGR